MNGTSERVAVSETEAMEFELWSEADVVAGVNDVCNLLVTLPSGQRFALNVWTYEFFERACNDGEELASHHLQQRYILPPDVFVVDLGRSTLEAVINDLLERDLMPKHCIVEEEN